MLIGIDVSSAQPGVDWAAVAASGRQFAWTKATEGTGYTSPEFAKQWAGIKAAGLARGAYHFARPDLANGSAAEADYFLLKVGDLESGDLLALDLEIGSGPLANWAITFLDRVTAGAGFRPMLYAAPAFLQATGCTNNPLLGAYGLWLADWTPLPPSPPPGWSFLAIWQHTNQAQVPGVAGPCDEDFFNGDLPQLLRYGKGGVVDPLLAQHARDWRVLRVENGQDPDDWGAFRAHEAAIGAPDPGAVPVPGWPAGFGGPAPNANNPNLSAQARLWRQVRRNNGQDPDDWAAFEHYEIAIGAPDPGPIPVVGWPAAYG